MDIISRSAWGARPPKQTPVYVAPSKRVYYVVHHSGAPVDQTVRAIQDWCMDGRGFNDIDYNFLVRGSTGEIYEGRGWDVVGAHTVDYNTSGAGVCIIGIDQASDAAKRSVRWLYEQYNKRCGKTLLIRGHRDLDPPRDCPGDRNEAWLKAGLPAPEMGDDMDQATFNALLDGYVERLSGLNGASAAQARLRRNWIALVGVDERMGDVVRRYDDAGNWVPETDANPRMTVASAVEYLGVNAQRIKVLVEQLGTAVDQVDEAVWARIPDPTIPLEEKAALLRAALGVDAAAVGALLQRV